MAISFQYNKTSLQGLEKQLKIRERSLPTIKNKESALRLEVKRAKDDEKSLAAMLESEIVRYEGMHALWNEFDGSLIAVKDVTITTRKVAGVRIPQLDEVVFEGQPYNMFNAPKWYPAGVEMLKSLARIGIEHDFCVHKLGLLEYARKKVTQKVNLFEKVQIPGYQDAIRKIKRYMEDEENLSKSSQKIVKTRQAAEKAASSDIVMESEPSMKAETLPLYTEIKICSSVASVISQKQILVPVKDPCYFAAAAIDSNQMLNNEEEDSL